MVQQTVCFLPFQLAAVSDSFKAAFVQRAQQNLGYPIATLPLSYLDYNGRPLGLSVIAAPYDEVTLLKVQSAWEATFGPRLPPPALID